MRFFSAFLLSITFVAGCSDSDSDAEFEAQVARDRCASECDDVNRFADCMPATKVTECKSACRNSSPASASDFADCVGGYFGDSTCEVTGCLGAVGVAEPGAGNNSNNGGTDPIAACKTNCDHVAVDCPEDTNANATAECKENCDLFPSDQVTSFNTCVDANRFLCASGDLIACYDNIGVLP